jgi:HAD superfamily hydrolase (TIGR01450 family)
MGRVAAPDVVTLSGTEKPLAQIYDVALLDLDGVVYVGQHAVAGAPEALRGARELGMRLAFVTNNAARPPRTVAEHLSALGIPARAEDVINSAQAAAHYLAERLGTGARVLVIGTVGLDEALAERGLTAVHSADDDPEAVVQGYSPELNWAQLAEGAVAIRRGIPWVATNVDPTVPSPRGPLPGNGSMVAALRHATGATPVVTGKPDPTMHRESVLRSGAQNPLVVGDRLDTDVEGANAAGCPSLLVLSGVTSAAELLAAPPLLRPTYLAEDVGGLLQAQIAPTLSAEGASCGRWSVHLSRDANLTLTARPGGAAPDGAVPDAMAALRALCAAAWRRAAADGRDAGRIGPVRGADAPAAVVLTSLGLAGPA